MNWSLIIFGLVALSSVAIAENSYLVIVPKLLKVGYDNQFSVLIATASKPVEVKFELTLGDKRIEGRTTVNAGETRNATLTIPSEFPVGPGELSIVGTGGVTFDEKRDVIVYDNRHVILVQTSASTYHPGDKMEVRVVATNEELIPLEKEEVLIEIYDTNLNLVGQFPRVAVRSGITETLVFPLSHHCNVGKWLVSATIRNTTSSVEVLVARPVTPSFDLKAFFQRFLLRTDKNLRGIIGIDSDNGEPIFGRAIIAVGQITEKDVDVMMKEQEQRRQQKEQPSPPQQPVSEEWRKWKSQQLEIAGRVEINYDLLSVFDVDVTKALAIQVYIQVTDLPSGQERFIQHIIPVFTRDVIYDIRPLEFEAGIKNEFQVIAKRPDGKPAKLEDLIVTITMLIGNGEGKMQEEKTVEIKDFYTRGRTDIAFFNAEIPENCIGVLMRITPLDEDGKVRGYRTHAFPLRPSPRRGANSAKLSIELLPESSNPVSTDAKTSVVSSQLLTVGRTANFYIQVLPSKPIEKAEPLSMSYVLLTDGRITRTGEFTIKATKECSGKTKRSIQPEVQGPPPCLFNGTLPIEITRAMMPYSTLLVYAFQPSLNLNLAEGYRFSVAGLFDNKLSLNATIVPFNTVITTPQNDDRETTEERDFSMEDVDLRLVSISERAQGKSRIQLTFTGTPDSTVGLNVVEYDATTQGLSNDITKERLLNYLTCYEHVPLVGMPTMPSPSGQPNKLRTRDMEADMSISETTTHQSETDERFNERAVISEEEEQRRIEREHMGHKVRYPFEKMVFGICSSRSRPVEGDDSYTTPNMGRLYGDVQTERPRSNNRRRGMKSADQFDVSVGENDYVVATGLPVIMKTLSMGPPNRPDQPKPGQPRPDLPRPGPPRPDQPRPDQPRPDQDEVEVEVGQQTENQESRERGPRFGTPAWYEKMHSKLSSFSQEAFTFMHSGLSVVTDFPSLRMPVEMKRVNLTELFSRYRKQSTLADLKSFTVRDEARQLLDQYLSESDFSMLPPPIMLEEQTRTGYYRSVFFNTSRIESQGTGKVILPQTRPYSTWVASGFALNAKSGLSIAQPIRLPVNQGLFILAQFPEHVQIGEHVLLTYGINNYLEKDLTNVVVRIRASADFDLIEQGQPEHATSSNGQDYTVTIPALKSLGVESRNIVLIPKRAGVVKIVLEVESEFGGDYEVLTTFVCESGVERRQVSGRLLDLTTEKKFGPIVEKITPSPFLRTVKIDVSGTGLEHLLRRHPFETNELVGVDRAISRMWRLLGLRRYLNETSRLQSPIFEATTGNATATYQKLQLYNNYNGSYSFISDQGIQESSLYLTSFAFGALISPFMPVRDNVTINRTLSWILSQQREDGSFDDEGPCFHYLFCTGEYRREALTALVLYSMIQHNVSQFVPEFVRLRLYNGEQSPVARAHHYLESRRDAVKSCILTTTLIDLVLLQCTRLPEQVRQQIYEDVRRRELVVVPEDGSKHLKVTDNKLIADDLITLNALTLSIYAVMNDWKTTSEISRWVVSQLENHTHYDTVLDGVFHTEAWLSSDLLYRRQAGAEKLSVTVDVTADNGQKQQFTIDSSNMDCIQSFHFTLPVNTITYTVSGSGMVDVCIKQIYVEKQQPQPTEPLPFQLTNEFSPMPWLNEIHTRTCVTYTPSPRDLERINKTFNRTIVVDVQIPSGMRLNLRQIGFFLSRVPEAKYFTFSERSNKISFFLNVPSTSFSKPICLDWCLERLSFVSSWAPVRVVAYDYLQPDMRLVQLTPVQLQPELLGYSYIDALIKSRPPIEELAKMQQEQQPFDA